MSAYRADSTRRDAATSNPNVLVAYLFGAVYVLVGLIGFLVSSKDGFAGDDGGKLLGIFGVNGLHNIVHIAIGLALILAARAGVRAARSANLTIGVVYLALGVLGWVIDGKALDIIALNSADHVLHLLSGAVLAG